MTPATDPLPQKLHASTTDAIEAGATAKPRGRKPKPQLAASIAPTADGAASTDASAAGDVDAVVPIAPPDSADQVARRRTASRIESSKEATVTLKSGRQLTLYRRQEFESRAHAKDFIHDFALAQGKRARLDPRMSGGRNFVYICNSQTKCDFIVRGARLNRKMRVGNSSGGGDAGKSPAANSSSGYYVTSFHADHGDECSGKTAITQRQVVNQLLMASEASSSSTAKSAALTGFDVQSIVKSVQGANVPSRMAYRAKDALAGKALHDVVSGIQKVESLLTQFQVLNPTASVRIDMDQENNFERAFLKLPHANVVQRFGARILGLDGLEMSRSSSSYKGSLLELVAKDGNNDSYVLAVALCEAPTTANLAWFLECCVTSGISFDVPVFCDRSTAMLSAAESLATPPLLIQCTQHLIDRMETMFTSSSLSKDWQKFVWRAQTADTHDEFDSALVSLSMLNGKAGEYLKAVDPNTWAKHCFLRKYSLYGWQTTTLTELENPIANAARHLNPFEFFQKYMERSMNDVYVRKSNAKEWVDAGRVLSLYAEEVLEEQKIEATSCCVSPSERETGSAYVWDTRALNPKKRRVNISVNSCSCAYPDQFGLPCKHLVAAVTFFNKSGASWDAHKLCHPMYSVQSYFEIYGHASAIQIPVEEELARNLSIKVKQVGTKRCSLCHAFGHNKRNCSSVVVAETIL